MLGNVEEFFFNFAMKAAEPSGSTESVNAVVTYVVHIVLVIVLMNYWHSMRKIIENK